LGSGEGGRGLDRLWGSAKAKENPLQQEWESVKKKASIKKRPQTEEGEGKGGENSQEEAKLV